MSRLLTLQDDNGGFEFVSNAFQIDPAPSNIDYLKKAIQTKNPATVQCDAFQIDIFSQQEEPLFVPPTRFASCSSFNDLPVRV
eukprot:g27005.t1